ncbi:MAG: 2-oxoacid ferredoxin oxidoreductase, partial [Thermoplasmata archaeon]|nr:2-oxoacid ferredoxin oxidoreductase [Thermoplasmata archaeon]NIS11660.1 2-oxoacid ferredoxin oxidoreductase [Thermoplasmata archaeon]NIS19558.1 2-oxoacid ferredoxin oxidoreductase [Thermoplasmata archaeon]NIT76710.1 2-oxoacid ferredoxin oxidoreductase [Thermoplasmata archaeon]NIU48671.1 2-oxoacid ferredoxin oxidoreductase [Thermoplasmata archaeon]
IIKEAILHKGYSLVDVLQPCVTFNKVNTHGWFRDNSYYLEETHNSEDRVEAFRRATETDRLPL